MKAIFTSLLLLTLLSSAIAQKDSLNYYYQFGKAGLDSADYKAYFDGMNRANIIRPNHPTILNHLINAAVLAEDVKAGVMAYKQMMSMNTGYELDSSSSYDLIRLHPDFNKIAESISNLNATVNHCNELMEVNLDTAHIESVAYSKSSGTYYFGGVHSRSIISIDKKGVRKTLVDYSENKDIYGVMGLWLQDDRNLLWACTAALPQNLNYTDDLEGKSSLFALDLTTNKVLQQYEGTDKTVFGDLKMDNQNRIWVSDGAGNKIHILENGELKVKYDLSDRLWNLQGITFNADYSKLYLADYILGLFELDLTTTKLRKMMMPADWPEKGIDGLYYSKGLLFALQNGTSPKRVLQLKLNQEGNMITEAQPLLQNADFLDEPTQGMILGDEFVFIANSPWSAYDENAKVIENEMKALKLMSFEIK